MTRRAWVRLDNASNIFLAARSDADPKVFRVSAEMDHEVDPLLLQEALETTFDRYRLFHAVLRRGVFWYYLQDSDLRPRVTAEDQRTCAPLYWADRHNLLFRVVHHRRRISLEVFHALCDGTGALWFLSELLSAYVRLCFPEQKSLLGAMPVAPDAPAGIDRTAPRDQEVVDEVDLERGFTADSFARYFRRHRRRRRRRRRGVEDSASAFSRAATSAVLTAADDGPPTPSTPRLPRRLRSSSPTPVHRVRGTRTPDNRTRAVELTMPADEVVALARAEGVALSMYLTAMFFESVRLSSGGLGTARTLAASAAVNLRQFFPSQSPRNFFAAVRVEHTYEEDPAGSAELGAIARGLESRFRPQVTAEALGDRLRRLIGVEQMLVPRLIPRPLKDRILWLINRSANRRLTVAISNLGRISLPEPADSHVTRMFFHVSAARPQFCSLSHAGLLTISFTSQFTETEHIREFARLLTAQGIDVTLAAAPVTEEELAEGEP